MRFDKHIKLITLSVEEDGLGGRTEVENVIMETMCNFEELSLETTVKIYGEAITQNAKAIVLGSCLKIDKVLIDDIKYKPAKTNAIIRTIFISYNVLYQYITVFLFLYFFIKNFFES